MLDKLHYFLPNTDESVHVYGDGRQTWVNVDGTVTLRLRVPFDGNRAIRAKELKRELQAYTTVTRALQAAGYATTYDFTVPRTVRAARTGAPNHFRDAFRFVSKVRPQFDGVACVDGELFSTDVYTIFNAPAPTQKTLWVPAYAARYIGKYWKDGRVRETDETVTFGNVTVKINPPVKNFVKVVRYLSRPTEGQPVRISDKNMKRVRTTFRGYPDPEYGEGFAKFTDGTRTVIVAPWKG